MTIPSIQLEIALTARGVPDAPRYLYLFDLLDLQSFSRAVHHDA
jgi:hypothetical protein